MSRYIERNENDRFNAARDPADPSPEVELPKPVLAGNISIEQALAERRSIRSYSNNELSLSNVAQLLWAAQGMTSDLFFRAAPSAGALYPLEVYLVAGNVSGLDVGVYRYVPSRHSMIRIFKGDRRDELCRASLSQSQIRDAAAVVVIAADYSRTTVKYGTRGIRYVHIEVGCAAENIYLQGVSLGIGTCAVGAFDDEEVASILNLPSNEDPLLILPIGYV
ncbi:SagB-type dehydrogenase domain-containing protein [Methanococcoides vulcani]|uniref:SagB-type dehydrogenase domain-containing protein n=1 Tax=Methanococcoides vulcani TaxID=1353158 RepID=A0A1I0B2R2_9EURY|nr:SagB/ThcOx family dehydrogenase [Methanococcoides vulcani]SET00957.1 SagB-type dehydrogenase domain-containing protein [Methanococcoides vulcani]